MLIQEYVADVMEQLRDFIPDGGKVEFEFHGCEMWADEERTRETVFVYCGDTPKRPIRFSVPMTGSRVKVPATPEERQS
ncbi:hypothetical protein [Mailhella sp.]